MRRYLLKFYIVLLTQYVITQGIQPNNSFTDESRHSRGRVVKLNSGPKLEPITCNDEGFLAEPTNCSIFYRCIKASKGKYTVVKFQCSPGTVYDPEIESCNHPQNTKRSECRSSRPFQFITAPVDQFNDNEIVPAVHEVPSPITTRKPIYNKQTSISELSSTSTSFPSPIPIAIASPGYGEYVPINLVQTTIQAQTNEITKTTVFQTPFSSITSTSQPQWTPPTIQYGSTTTIKEARLGNECIHDGFMGDIEDCRKFYRCVNDQRGGFKKFEFMCSESTIWDDDIQSCNHPWAVRHRRCGRDTSYVDYGAKNDEYYSQKNNSLIEKELANFESNKTEIPIKVSLPSGTLNQNNYEGQISDNEDKAWNYNNNVINYIPSNLQRQTYNPIREKEVDYNTQSYETITKASTYVPDIVLHGSSYNINTDYNVKSNACSESGFMGDPQDCKKFYRCVENGRGSFIKHEFQCGEGTAWDKNIESCNHVWMVKDCKEGGVSNSFSSEHYEPENMYTTLPNTIKDDTSSNNGYNNWNDNEKHNVSTPTTVLPVVTEILEEPSKRNESQEICNSVGFMGNRNNCKVFYRCVENSNGGFTKFEYLCGDGTAWDPSIEACNHVGLVKHCGSNVENQTIASISSTDSTITAASFVPTTVQSNDNKPLAPSENNDHSHDYQSNDIHKDPIRTTESTTVVNVSNITATSSNKINSCINSGFIGDNLDCKKFYRCVSNGDGSFKQYEFSCGEGTVWDPEIDACNHAWAVKKCGGSSSNKNEVSTMRSTTTEAISNGFENGYPTQGYDQTKLPVQNTVELSTNSVTVADKGLPCQQAGFMADKNDCKRFYRCVENGLGGFDRFEFYCGEGTLWDSNIQACNHASSVKDCGTANYNTTPSSTVETTQSLTTVFNEVDKNNPGYSETESPTTIKILYANKTCTSDGFYADENDCQKFYRCVKNDQGGYLKYEFSCGDGTVWDQSIQSCNHASIDIEKCKGSVTTSATRVPPSVSTPGSTESYNTLHPEESSTQENNEYIPDKSSSCTAEGFYPNSNDCKKFFRCVNNGKGYIRYDFTCGEGTIWVQDIQACDHDNDNSTCSTQSATVNEVTPTTQPTSSHVDIEHSTNEDMQSTTVKQYEETKTTEGIMATASTTSMPEPTSDKEVDSNIAECKSEGYYGSKEDCQKFYRCVNDGKGKYVRYDYICGDGTIWDQDILTCNHPRDVTNRSCDNKTTSTPSTENTEESVQSTTTTSSTQSLSTSSMSTQTATSTISPQTVTSTTMTQTTSSSTTTQSTISPTSTETTTSAVPTYTTTSSTTTQTETSAMPTQTATPSKSTQTTISSSSTESTTSSNEGSSQETSISSEEGTSKNPTNKNITCTKAGFYPHPTDCKKFYRCVDWDGDGSKFSVFHFECGEGTIWDPALDTCNYEESVYPPRDCSATQAQGNSTSQSTTTTTTESTTTPLQSSSETTSTQSTVTEEQTTEQQHSTNQMSSSSTTPTDTTSTTVTSSDTSSTTVSPTEITSTTVRQTDTTSTTSDQITTQQSTTDSTTTQSEKSTTTTVDTSTSDNTSSTSEQSTISEQTSTTTESTTSITEQQTSTTLEQSSTEQSTTQTTLSTTEDTTSQGSTTEQQTSTDSSTDVANTSTSEATPTSTTTTGSTTENIESTTQGSSSVKDCPDTEDGQYLYACPTSFKRHPKYCNLFYQCIENNDNHELKIATFNCPNGTIYDESKIQCVEESKAAKKCQGAIAQNRRIKRLNFNSKETISVSGNKYGCTGVGHFPFEKNEECSPAILKCEISKRGKLQGFVYRCPDNYVYWSVSRRCEPILRMAACKYSSNQWNGRPEIPIETTNIA